MQIVIRYTSPLVRFTGKHRETLDLPEHASVRDAIHYLAEIYGAQLLQLFYDDAQEFDPAMLTISRNGEAYDAYDDPLAENDEIALIAQIAGG